MYTHARKYILLVLGLLFVVACSRTAPQRPSQRNGVSAKTETDSSLLAMMSVNRRLSEQADLDVARYIERASESYSQLPSGAWIGYPHREEPLLPEGALALHMVVRRLTGELLLDSEREVRLGREALPVAVEEALPLADRGEKLELVCPWYTAFGAQGTEGVGPYENVRIEIEIH